MSHSRSTGVPTQVRNQMYEVMTQTVGRIFPPTTDPTDVIKPHVWRNSNYVGMANGQVQAWYGWSLNCKSLKQGYRTLYFDYAENHLSPPDRERLFGELFAQSISLLNDFVFLFVTSIRFEQKDIVIQEGFIYRRINKIIHPGCLVETGVFLKNSPEDWANKAFSLLTLQQSLLA